MRSMNTEKVEARMCAYRMPLARVWLGAHQATHSGRAPMSVRGTVKTYGMSEGRSEGEASGVHAGAHATTRVFTISPSDSASS